MGEKRYPKDAEGFQACQLCQESVRGRAFVQLERFIVSDGVEAGILREYEDEDDPEWDPEECDLEISGPVFHLGCVEPWLWGLAQDAHVLKAEHGEGPIEP